MSHKWALGRKVHGPLNLPFAWVLDGWYRLFFFTVRGSLVLARNEVWGGSCCPTLLLPNSTFLILQAKVGSQAAMLSVQACPSLALPG